MPVTRPITALLLTLGIALALSQGSHLTWQAWPAIALLLIAGALVQRSSAPAVKAMGHGLFIVTGLALALHQWPGFNNAAAFENLQSSPDAAPFSLFFNLDKPLIGLWLLLFCPRLFTPAPSLKALYWIGLTPLITLGIAWGSGSIGWQPKWPAGAWWWLLNNLLLVSLVEELLFRGYVQQGLQRWMPAWAALGATAVLFGIAHLGGGWPLMLLASIAGLGYGLAWRHGGVLAATFAHLAVNLLHFALFTYPIRLQI